jgi:hypothetical protein
VDKRYLCIHAVSSSRDRGIFCPLLSQDFGGTARMRNIQIFIQKFVQIIGGISEKCRKNQQTTGTVSC